MYNVKHFLNLFKFSSVNTLVAQKSGKKSLVKVDKNLVHISLHKRHYLK